MQTQNKAKVEIIGTTLIRRSFNSSVESVISVDITEIRKASNQSLLGLVDDATSDFMARGKSAWLPLVKEGKLEIDTAQYLKLCAEKHGDLHKEEKELANQFMESINSETPLITWEDIEISSAKTAKELGIKPLASREYDSLVDYLIRKSTKESENKAKAEAEKLAKVKNPLLGKL